MLFYFIEKKTDNGKEKYTVDQLLDKVWKKDWLHIMLNYMNKNKSIVIF